MRGNKITNFVLYSGTFRLDFAWWDSTIFFTYSSQSEGLSLVNIPVEPGRNVKDLIQMLLAMPSFILPKSVTGSFLF
jgi:hypothetical protein